MTDESNFYKEIDNNKNKNSVRCQFCDSVILKAKSANYSENEVSPREKKMDLRKIIEKICKNQ